jgi:hypothetical protein
MQLIVSINSALMIEVWLKLYTEDHAALLPEAITLSRLFYLRLRKEMASVSLNSLANSAFLVAPC